MNSQLFLSEFASPDSRRRSKLILSVDDEANILYTREAILEAEGYTVLSASEGEDALELFDAHPVIDLVLLDFAMPGMDGLTIAREMKSRRPSVPIYMVSAHEAALLKLNPICVDAFIWKGTGPAYLLHKVNQLFSPVAALPRSA
jgi:CheY-like chemotaxis protein